MYTTTLLFVVEIQSFFFCILFILFCLKRRTVEKAKSAEHDLLISQTFPPVPVILYISSLHIHPTKRSHLRSIHFLIKIVRIDKWQGNHHFYTFFCMYEELYKYMLYNKSSYTNKVTFIKIIFLHNWTNCIRGHLNSNNKYTYNYVIFYRSILWITWQYC